jgi:anti-sigma factor ChrR (cupin superfamily)
MKHAMQDLAADYALGALDAPESEEFRQHLEGCPNCREELSSFEETVGALGLAPPATEPPARVRERLVESLSGYRSIRAADGEWNEMMPGVMLKRLHIDHETGVATSLVRMSPGTALPRHRHENVERFLILEGECQIGDEMLGPGDFHVAERGSVHNSTSTTGGTLLLLVAGENYNFGESG